MQEPDTNQTYAWWRRAAKRLLGPRVSTLVRSLLPQPEWLSSQALESLTPTFLRSWRRREIFSRIYAHNLWGHGGADKFFSGQGSRGPAVDAYIEMITAELTKIEQELRREIKLVDLGCGDFTIGREITARLPKVYYLGCDIVPTLIEHHQANYADTRTAFRLLDIVSDELPDGDACLIRQVLQHLSNDDIGRIIKKLDKYSAIYVSEGQPVILSGPANLPKPTGAGVRFDWRTGRGRGVELDQPPFGLKVLPVLVARISDLENVVTVKLLRHEPRGSTQ